MESNKLSTKRVSLQFVKIIADCRSANREETTVGGVVCNQLTLRGKDGQDKMERVWKNVKDKFLKMCFTF